MNKQKTVDSKVLAILRECPETRYDDMQLMSDKQLKSNMSSVPIWKKMNLTVEEASEYSGIGTSKIKELSNCEDCPFVLWNGAKRLIKRKQFEEYLSSQYSL